MTNTPPSNLWNRVDLAMKICEVHGEDPAWTNDIRKDLAYLEAQLAEVNRNSPHLANTISELSMERAQLTIDNQKLEARLAAAQEEIKKLRTTWMPPEDDDPKTENEVGGWRCMQCPGVLNADDDLVCSKCGTLRRSCEEHEDDQP